MILYFKDGEVLEIHDSMPKTDSFGYTKIKNISLGHSKYRFDFIRNYQEKDGWFSKKQFRMKISFHCNYDNIQKIVNTLYKTKGVRDNELEGLAKFEKKLKEQHAYRCNQRQLRSGMKYYFPGVPCVDQ